MSEELQESRIVSDPIEGARAVSAMIKQASEDQDDMRSARLKVHHVHRKLHNKSSSFRVQSKAQLSSLIVLTNMVRGILRDVSAFIKTGKTEGADPWAQATLRLLQEQLNTLLVSFKTHTAEISDILLEIAQLDEDTKDMQTCLKENLRLMLLVYTNYIDRVSRTEQINDLREFGKIGVEASDREALLQPEDMSNPNAHMPVYNRRRPLHTHPFSMTPVITGASRKARKNHSNNASAGPVPVAVDL